MSIPVYTMLRDASYFGKCYQIVTKGRQTMGMSFVSPTHSKTTNFLADLICSLLAHSISVQQLQKHAKLERSTLAHQKPSCVITCFQGRRHSV